MPRWAFPVTPNLDKLEARGPKRELFFIAGNHDWYDGLSAFSHQFCYEGTASAAGAAGSGEAISHSASLQLVDLGY